MGHQYTGTDSYATNFTIPDDGDTVQASAFNVAYEALGDRTTYLKKRVGKYQLVDMQIASLSVLGTLTVGGTSTRTLSSYISAGLNLAVGDIVELLMPAVALLHVGSTNVANTDLIIQTRDRQGAAPVADMIGGFVEFYVVAGGATNTDVLIPYTLSATRVISTPGVYSIDLIGTVSGNTGDSAIAGVPPVVTTFRVWRAT